MAKIALTKLNLNKTIPTSITTWNDQEIEVKHYLPIQEKLKMIEGILNRTVDDINFYNPCKIDIYLTIEIILNYTNINVTEKQKEDLYKLYDSFVGSGLYDAVVGEIPQQEYDTVVASIWDNIEAVYQFKNSAMGVLEALKVDYSDMNLNAEAVQEKIANKENLQTVRNILNALDTNAEMALLGKDD